MDWRVGLLLICMLAEDTEALRMLELVVPQYVVRGQNIRLECNFNLDGEALYSVKWYKDGNEFYRYVPQDRPPVLVFQLPGVTANIHNSTERSVVLYSVNLMSTGRYRCEVSAEAPSFQTVSDHSDMMVVALPEDGPVITGRPGRHRYQVRDVVRFNCTSAKSKPAAMLSWFINGEPVDTQYLRGPHITEVDREGLETAVLGLEFRLRANHFKRGDLKIKCLATIATVYWKSNELSIEGEKPLKMPVMESRETRAQGHTHAEHILGGKIVESRIPVLPLRETDNVAKGTVYIFFYLIFYFILFSFSKYYTVPLKITLIFNEKQSKY
ncbi:uncharacterized protein LOC114880254 isoform X1 [Osmia bicornis bicornis]|uniref:uncharacterized protein LOC114880254 isoform X1 n=1 Tax=Osmia bicornis bicornis TaxID=1437191 RepID=UPI001EAF89FA|nr:uncharacterized protein LOC114880254 isoform X1 [Osmia bicornis bicornis]